MGVFLRGITKNQFLHLSAGTYSVINEQFVTEYTHPLLGIYSKTSKLPFWTVSTIRS